MSEGEKCRAKSAPLTLWLTGGKLYVPTVTDDEGRPSNYFALRELSESKNSSGEDIHVQYERT